MYTIIGQRRNYMTSPALKLLILNRINLAPVSIIWTPIDFLDLGKRYAVDKALQRLVHSETLQRIGRGLYTKKRINPLTTKPAAPDYQQVVEAISRRDQVKLLIDGMSAANALGLTNTVPGQVIVHTDGRLRPIKLGKLVIKFKVTAPSKLYWAGHPAMYIIQALYWLQDSLKTSDINELRKIELKLMQYLSTSGQREKICQDLLSGLHTVPFWMQERIRKLAS